MEEKKSFVSRITPRTYKLLKLAVGLPEFHDQNQQDIVDEAIRSYVEDTVKKYYDSEKLESIISSE